MSIDFKTYSASVVGYNPPALPTDIMSISGIDLAQVRIYRISVSGTATTAGSLNFSLIKRSSLNTAGTPTALTAVPHDSLDPAAAAVVQTYGSNPNLGQTVGHVRGTKVHVPVAGSFEAQLDFAFGQEDKPLILNNSTEQLSLNLNGLALPLGTSIAMDIEWAEE